MSKTDLCSPGTRVGVPLTSSQFPVPSSQFKMSQTKQTKTETVQFVLMMPVYRDFTYEELLETKFGSAPTKAQLKLFESMWNRLTGYKDDTLIGEASEGYDVEGHDNDFPQTELDNHIESCLDDVGEACLDDAKEAKCCGCDTIVDDEDDYGNNADVADTCCKECWEKHVEEDEEESE